MEKALRKEKKNNKKVEKTETKTIKKISAAHNSSQPRDVVTKGEIFDVSRSGQDRTYTDVN